MQSERTAITETIATAVSNKLDLAVTQAVTHALTKFSAPSSIATLSSPNRKKCRHTETENTVTMVDGDEH
jgi:rRNA-processing protein FCF1